MPIVLKSGSLNLLEPSGPVQACNGIALPFMFTLLEDIYRSWVCATLAEGNSSMFKYIAQCPVWQQEPAVQKTEGREVRTTDHGWTRQVVMGFPYFSCGCDV